ncbi:uncharacterized protein KIAA2012 homolog [Alosa alosa]|nr:uncharacterized protein KIAA2012 homolog [Alosa alosa]
MEESERRDYLQRLQEEEEERSRVEQERRRRQEEALLWAKEQARIQAQLQARQRALLEQRLSFQRGLQQEAGGLGQSQDISRPWVFSYFTLLQLLGLSDPASSPEGPGAGPDSPQLTPT